MRRPLGYLAGMLLLASMWVGAQESAVYLKAPGLRLIKDPAVVIPAAYTYLNRALSLPGYRDAVGAPAAGWSRKYISTRRFQSDQSAWIYYRRKDLQGAVILHPDRPDDGLCIWPGGSFLVLESYQGGAADGPTRAPLEIDVMSKAERNTPSYGDVFFTAEWSYARFTSRGDRSAMGAKAGECHQCHGIALQLTGDLVFTRFP